MHFTILKFNALIVKENVLRKVSTQNKMRSEKNNKA